MRRFQRRPGLMTTGTLFIAMLLLAALTPNLFAGMDVMTDKQLEDVKGGELLSIDVSDPGYYNTSENVTVVRFSSDIYVENYGEFSEMRLGNYDRTVNELGPMMAVDSDNVLDYDQTRANPMDGTDFGGKVNLRANLDGYENFGAPAGPDYAEWDINWEGLQTGISDDMPLRLYGVVLRAEFTDFGSSSQELRRLIIGSNKLYGYATARPMVTSGWLNSQLVRLPDDSQGQPLVGTMGPDQVDRIFQLQRDMFLDQYWQISSFDLNPNEGKGFREYIFNTNMAEVNLLDADLSNNVGSFVDQNHGFFLMLDLTNERFSGWNIIAGVNEYMGWPELESDSATKNSPPPDMINPGPRPGYDY